ncbi:MAG: TAXI family TRAP transporter solute-binding subunit [Hyphomicrobiaceae bacterium]
MTKPHRRKWRAISAIAATTAIVLPAASMAAEVALPKQLSWTAYESGSSGYTQSVAIGNMLKKRYNTEVRIIPGKNDVSRMTPLKVGQSKLCACGVAAYYAQEGVLMFAEKAWGPQRIYNLFNNNGRNGQTLAASAKSGIKSAADLKGKRLTWVKGAPALNRNMEAFLAFGGLTWNDVQKVEVPGWGQSIDAVINGQADAAWGSTVSSKFAQLVSSPEGLYFPPLPHADKAGWARALKITPWWIPSKVEDVVPGYKGPVPYEGGNVPYPIFVSTADAPDDLAYGLTKAVMEHYDDFKDGGPGMDGYKLSSQIFEFRFPFHPASVRYFKEKGVWTAAHDAHNAALLKRQDVLAAAWKELTGKSPADESFSDVWMKARAAALGKAGMEVVFE